MTALPAEVREILRKIAHRHGLTGVRLFGSIVRDEAGDDSDVDVLALFPPDFTLLTHARVQREMSEAAGRRVDLVSENGLRPRVRERVLREAAPL